MKHLKIELDKYTYTGYSKEDALSKMPGISVIGSTRVACGYVSYNGYTKGINDSQKLYMYHASKVNAHSKNIRGVKRRTPTLWTVVVTVIPFGLLEFLPAGTKIEQHSRHWSITAK